MTICCINNPLLFCRRWSFSQEIVLATHQPLSGPAQEYSEIGKSALAYFKYVKIKAAYMDVQLN
ncbi:MAG: hypothetical protein Ct9H300mP28_12080 [Pseudomonadota bacterium]|nr:MAG: hypothetical protein Ct9H300mP28_12080 [Pseudomonadota bacterium]